MPRGTLSELLKRLAGGDASVRAKADAALVPPLNYDLDRLRKSLAPEQVTVKTLPPNLVRDWVLPDGRARVQALPKGDPNDTNVLRNFADRRSSRRTGSDRCRGQLL